MIDNKIVMVGAGGHCSVLIEACQAQGYDIVGILDNEFERGAFFCGYEVLGTDKDALSVLEREGTKNVCVAFAGDLHARKACIAYYADLGCAFPILINEPQYLSDSVRVAKGSVLLPGCIVNANAVLGMHVTVNSGAIVEHGARVGDYAHIAPRATLLGACEVGCNTFIGAGSVVLPLVKIGDNCVIGAGAVVLHDVPANSKCVGNPARAL